MLVGAVCEVLFVVWYIVVWVSVSCVVVVLFGILVVGVCWLVLGLFGLLCWCGAGGTV